MWGAIGYEIKDCNPLQSMLDCRGARAWEHTPNNSPGAFYAKTLEGLERGREYTFRIRSRSGAEFSDWSESLEVTPGMPFRVSVKAEMSYDAGGAPEVRLTWDAVKHAAGIRSDTRRREAHRLHRNRNRVELYGQIHTPVRTIA